jgi:hypothetical protein
MVNHNSANTAELKEVTLQGILGGVKGDVENVNIKEFIRA